MLPRRAERRALMTVLFTDIVASTETAAKLGDRQWKELVRQHHAAVRRALRTHRGREVDTAGDGFFAVFQQPGDAIQCAVAARAAIAGLGLQIRAGIHTGEVEHLRPKVAGLAVVIGARVLATCEPGQIRVTSTVRELVTGSGFDFAQAGTHSLKGVPGEWLLFALAVDAPALAPLPHLAPRPVSGLQRRLPWLVLGSLIAAAGATAAFFLLQAPPATTVSPVPNSVVAFDPASGTFTRMFEVGGGPAFMTTDGTDLWVASEAARTLTHVRLESGTSTQVGLESAPTGLTVADGTVYVTHAFEHSVERFDDETDAPAAPMNDLVVRALVFADGDAWGIDPVADDAVHLQPGHDPTRISLRGGGGASDITVGLDAVWVAETLGSSIIKIEPAGGQQTPISVRHPPTAIRTSTRVVWVASEIRDSLISIEPRTGAILGTVAVCNAPIDLAASGAEVWVACAGSRELAHVAADGVVQRYPLPATPSAILVLHNTVWVTLRAD